MNLYARKNGRKVEVLYPVNGRKNILRKVVGVKTRSFTGPNGPGIVVTEQNGQIRSLSVKKIVTL